MGRRSTTILTLLHSRVHEERSLALLLLVDAFKRGDEAGRAAIYELYLAHTVFINNWDLVDCVGGADRRRLAARARAARR